MEKVSPLSSVYSLTTLPFLLVALPSDVVKLNLSWWTCKTLLLWAAWLVPGHVLEPRNQKRALSFRPRLGPHESRYPSEEPPTNRCDAIPCLLNRSRNTVPSKPILSADVSLMPNTVFLSQPLCRLFQPTPACIPWFAATAPMLENRPFVQCQILLQ